MTCCAGISRLISSYKVLVAAAMTPFVAACGLYTPSFQENSTDRVAGQQLFQAVAYNVTCEVRDAINYIYNNPDLKRETTFLDSWGANIALNLQIEEKGSANPVAVGLPPSPASAVFSIAGSASLSSDATRQDKTNSFYTVKKLRELGPCIQEGRPGGILLMQRDLGLSDWLNANVIASDRNLIDFSKDYADGINKTNVLSHEIKFDVTTTGSLIPAWKLTRALINQSGTFLSATRDRTNDLIVTFGPTLTAPKAKVSKDGKVLRDARGRAVLTPVVVGLSPMAEQAAFVSQVGLAVSNGNRSLFGP